MHTSGPVPVSPQVKQQHLGALAALDPDRAGVCFQRVAGAQCVPVDLDRATSNMNIAFPSLRQGMLCAFGAIEQSRVEKRVLMDADRAGAPVGRGDEAQTTALFFGREALLLIGGRDAGDVGLDPALEEMRAACLVVVVLAVQ